MAKQVTTLAPVGYNQERNRALNRGGRPKVPQGEPVIFTPPPHLGPVEKELWLYLAEATGNKLKCCTAEDLVLFEGLVQAWATHRACAQFFREKRLEPNHKPGEEYAYMSVDEKTGKILYRSYPQCATMNEAAMTMTRLCTHFGLSPATRAKVGMAGGDSPGADLDGEFT